MKGKVRRINHSYYVSIPIKDIRERSIEEYDTLTYKLLAIDKEVPIKRFKCLVCSNIFDIEDKEPYCTICESEDLQELEDDI